MIEHFGPLALLFKCVCMLRRGPHSLTSTLSCSTPGAVQHVALSAGHRLLYEGCVLAAEVPILQGLIYKVMSECLDRKKRQGQKGHQYTPAFIHAVVKHALGLLGRTGREATEVEEAVKVLPNVLAAGGFSDVGAHTGSKPRDTCWPLVQAAVQVRVDMLWVL